MSDVAIPLPVVDHPGAAARFNADVARTDWHDASLWFVREKRDKAMHGVPEWEALRELASQIKEHTLSHLDDYLIQFEQQATANGIQVHWAQDADEHNRIVHGILQEKGVQRLVKSKSHTSKRMGSTWWTRIWASASCNSPRSHRATS